MPEMTAAEAAEHVARITGVRAALILSDAFTAGCQATRARWLCVRDDGPESSLMEAAREVLQQHHAALSANAAKEGTR